MAKRRVPIGEPKKCTVCQQTFPNTEAYFWRNRKDDPLSLMAKCKTCQRKEGADYRKANPEKSHERAHRHYYKDIEKSRAQTCARVMRHYDTHHRSKDSRCLPAPGEPKECSGCQQPFPYTPQYFPRLHKGDDLHLSAKCKSCAAKKQRDWAAKNPEKVRAHSRRHYYKDLEASHAEQKRSRMRRKTKQAT